jgi:hypothetical protein
LMINQEKSRKRNQREEWKNNEIEEKTW